MRAVPGTPAIPLWGRYGRRAGLTGCGVSWGTECEDSVEQVSGTSLGSASLGLGREVAWSAGSWGLVGGVLGEKGRLMHLTQRGHTGATGTGDHKSQFFGDLRGQPGGSKGLRPGT